MTIQFKSIGYVKHNHPSVPRHWAISDLVGDLVINEEYLPAIKDIKPGERIVAIFHFHKSPEFKQEYLTQHHHRSSLGTGEAGVFSICSPLRPNPIGMSVLEALEINQNTIRVKGLDMLDGTPILDIKPHVEK